MRYLTCLAIAAVCVALIGCSSTPNAGSATVSGVNGDQSAASAGASADAPADKMPAPPPDAQYTLLCATFNQPTHISDAVRAKEYLISHTEFKDWYVIHSEQESDLYYGFYKTYDDKTQTEEYARARADHDKVAGIVNQDGTPLFPQVIFVPINLPDPPAPAEWELTRNPGYWTLQIAVYRDNPQRKQAAVDAVRAARAQGVEAYFYHGIASSSVYVGSWSKDAARIINSAGATSDPHQKVLVLSGPIAGAENQNFYDKQGNQMAVVMPHLDVYDVTMKQTMANYPYTYINGEVVGRRSSNSGQVVPYPSFLIRVPHGGEVQEAGEQGDAPSPDQLNQPDQDSQMSPPDTGWGDSSAGNPPGGASSGGNPSGGAPPGGSPPADNTSPDSSLGLH
jgi:hypothetical protein